MNSVSRKSFLSSIPAGAVALLSALGCKRQAGSPAAQPVQGKSERLAERVFQDNIAAAVTGAAYIGDRLGLFRAMAGAGQMSAAQLAAKTGLNARYVLEWLRAMASSTYIDYHPASGTFELPAENAAVLVDEDSPLFLAGIIEGTVPDMIMAPRVMAAFRTGRGIPYSEFPPETFEGIERSTKPEYRHLLTQQWLPAVPGLIERLRAGGSAADLGSGAGLASIAIARAFPKTRCLGFEPYAPSVERARVNAQQAGLAERVKFETFDGVHVPGGPYDLVTINYSLHHAGDPLSLLRATRRVLAPGGTFLIVEFRKSARLEEDINTPRQFCYAFGLLECLPTALAEGGPGYGTGITEPDVRQLAEKAGFREFMRVLPDDPLRALFVLRG